MIFNSEIYIFMKPHHKDKAESPVKNNSAFNWECEDPALHFTCLEKKVNRSLGFTCIQL